MVCCNSKIHGCDLSAPSGAVVKPWGFYITHHTSDDKSVCFKTLVINCGYQISLQRHEKRSEVWWIADENAYYELTVAEEKSILRGKHRIDVPVGYIHCIKNMSSYPLVIYEMQYGNSCEESDIIRIVDPYKDQR